MTTSSKSHGQYHDEQTAVEPNMAALLSRQIIESLPPVTMEDPVGDLLASLDSALVDFSRTKNAGLYLATKIASLYMQNKMQLLTQLDEMLRAEHYM